MAQFKRSAQGCAAKFQKDVYKDADVIEWRLYLMEEDWVVLCQALRQSIKEEEWIEMHEKKSERSRLLVCQRWRGGVHRKFFFSAKVEREQAINRRSALTESLCQCGGLTPTGPCECARDDRLRWTGTGWTTCGHAEWLRGCVFFEVR